MWSENATDDLSQPVKEELSQQDPCPVPPPSSSPSAPQLKLLHARLIPSEFSTSVHGHKSGIGVRQRHRAAASTGSVRKVDEGASYGEEEGLLQSLLASLAVGRSSAPIL